MDTVNKRTRSVSVKMSEKVYERFVQIAHTRDIAPSLMGYLIIKQYIDRVDTGFDSAIDDLI